MSDAPVDPPVSLVKDSHGGPASTAAAGTPVEGCLVVALRMPVRIVTLVLILPVRMLWDVLSVCGRALKRTVWLPFARAMSWLWESVLAPVLYALFVWPWLALRRYLLAPVGRALAWVATAVGRGMASGARGIGAALAWLGRTLVVTPLTWIHARLLAPVGAGLLWALGLLVVAPAVGLYRYVLAPLGRGLVAGVRGVGAGLAWLWRHGVVVPSGLAYRYVLAPLGRGLVAGVRGVGAGLAWLWRHVVVAPCVFVHRWVLAPLGRGIAVVAREIAEALGHAWRVAGYVSRAVFRFFGAVLRFLIADPAVWMWQHIVRPFGNGFRDVVWRPAVRVVREAGRDVRAAFAAARASVRETRAELRRALFGARSVTEREPLPENGRVSWGAGSPHNSATTPNSFGSKRDDADFRTL